MGQPNLNRQFVLLDFADLDNPVFGDFMRSGEFATYLYMRRYVWRSAEHHSRYLERWFADGYLVCGLSRRKLAKCSGVRERQITTDIARLLDRKVIEVRGDTSEQVFVLGRWKVEEGVHVEYFYLDRLCPRSAEINCATHATMAENCQSAVENADYGRKLPESLAENCQSPGQELWQKTATMNRECPNRELGIEDSWQKIPDEIRSSLQLRWKDTLAKGWSDILNTVQILQQDHSIRLVCPSAPYMDNVKSRLLPAGVRCDLQNAFGREVKIEVVNRKDMT